MTKLKIGIAAVVGILLLVVILQNTETVATRLLFVTVEMPRAALLLLTLLIGFVLGLIAALSVSRRKKPGG